MAASESNKKNTEEQKPQKSQQQILQHTEEAALTQLNREPLGLTLSGISAGLDIGFSVLLMTVTLTSFKGVLPDAVTKFLVANMYPVGFIFVILGRSELFTEHTTLAVLPVLQRLASIKKLLRLWLIVYISNLAGGIIFAFILNYFANSLHFLQPWALAQLSGELVKNSWSTLLLMGILAGWLMGLLAWLVAAARETISQIFIIYIVTAAIGLTGLSHCVVGGIETFTGFLNGNVSFQQYLKFMSAVTFGNIIGGSCFVAILKYNHTALSGDEKEVDLEDGGKIKP